MDRGQAHTLEGIVAGIVLLASLVFALQATAVTPQSASTSNEYIGTQLRSTAEGVLVREAETGSIEDMLLQWDNADASFTGVDEEGYYTKPGQPPAPNRFIEALQRAYNGQGVAFNIWILYENGEGKLARTELLYQGEPTDNAVSASRTVPLYDDDTFTGTTQLELDNPSSTYLVPDSNPDNPTPLYAAVTVEVVIWRL